MSTKNFDYVGAIIAYEDGQLDDAEVNDLFQYLVDTGVIVALQGSYQRTAMALIRWGRIEVKR
jgi:hypothetical protein